jgi:hypothetical protein
LKRGRRWISCHLINSFINLPTVLNTPNWLPEILAHSKGRVTFSSTIFFTRAARSRKVKSDKDCQDNEIKIQPREMSIFV